MDAENIEVSEQSDKRVTLPYLVYVFGVGIASIVLLIYWGVTGFSFPLAILIGGLIQLIFRVSKRMWSNILNPQPGSIDSKKVFLNATVEIMPTAKVFLFIYFVMIIVSAFWYSVGWLFS